MAAEIFHIFNHKVLWREQYIFKHWTSHHSLRVH